MEVELTSLFIQLKLLRESIVKLGPSRRKGGNFDKKINDAKALHDKFKSIVSRSSKFSEELTQLIVKIEKLYVETIKFEDVAKIEQEMAAERFCLRTAVSLLPKMSGDEQVTQDLIDAIGLYSSMLEGADNSLLIKFVLTTRLTQGARIRLSSNYATIDSLLADMRKHLLTVESDVAVQAKLSRARQNNKSVADFGAEIGKLMVNLTISQAGESSEAYKILRPLNEKYAIRKFADGLRNQRLATVITARNLTCLKDAIRVAEDEDCASSAQVMTYQRWPARGGFSTSNRNRGSNYRRHTVENRHARHETAVGRTRKNVSVWHNGGMRGRSNNVRRERHTQQGRGRVACFEHARGDADSGAVSMSRSVEGGQLSETQFFRD